VLAEGLPCRPRPRRPAPSAWIDLHVDADLRVILQRMAESRARMFPLRVEAASFRSKSPARPGATVAAGLQAGARIAAFRWRRPPEWAFRWQRPTAPR